jgi:hypothetical protein
MNVQHFRNKCTKDPPNPNDTSEPVPTNKAAMKAHTQLSCLRSLSLAKVLSQATMTRKYTHIVTVTQVQRDLQRDTDGSCHFAHYACMPDKLQLYS